MESVLRSVLVALTDFSDLLFFSIIHDSIIIVICSARYGLPVGFQALLLQPDKKHMKKLREELASLFKHLDPTAAASKTDVRGHTAHRFQCQCDCA